MLTSGSRAVTAFNDDGLELNVLCCQGRLVQCQGHVDPLLIRVLVRFEGEGRSFSAMS